MTIVMHWAFFKLNGIHLLDKEKSQNRLTARGGPLFGKFLKGMRTSQIGRERPFDALIHLTLSVRFSTDE